MAVTVIGIDPGPVDTGIVTRCGRDVLAQEVIHNDRPATGHGVTSEYLGRVVAAIDRMLRTFEPTTSSTIHLAIEGCTVPRGRAEDGSKRFVHPRDLLGLGIVFGHVTGAHRAVVIQPNHHGRGAFISYPDCLKSPRERPRKDGSAPQNSPFRHLRSAWDISLSLDRPVRRAA